MPRRPPSLFRKKKGGEQGKTANQHPRPGSGSRTFCQILPRMDSSRCCLEGIDGDSFIVAFPIMRVILSSVILLFIDLVVLGVSQLQLTGALHASIGICGYAESKDAHDYSVDGNAYYNPSF